MAASRGHASESSSSEDDEEMEKFREAAWSFGATNGSDGSHLAGTEKKDKLSRRVDVSRHEHDGNELQTTPGFRAHVAKKLGVLLDSCISDAAGPELEKLQTTPCATKIDEDEEHDGFRLFSTSIPGTTQSPPPPPPRRSFPSSSDSDSEMDERLKEAAVSVTDLLPSLLIPKEPHLSCSPAPIPVEVKRKKKKKKKNNENEAGGKEEDGPDVKKQRADTDEEDDSSNRICSGSTTQQEGGFPVDSASLPTSVQRKKEKKKKKVHSLKLSD